MATTAGNALFVDANVLVYSAVVTSPFHAEARAALADHARRGTELWLSRQVLREYIATTSRPQTYANPSPIAAIQQDIGRFLNAFRVAEDGPAVTSQLLALLGAVACGGKQVHDANVVATMLAHGLPNLLTHNTADFARFAAYITVVPLVPPTPPAPPPPLSPGPP